MERRGVNKLQIRDKHLRTKLGKRDQQEFIIVLTKPPDEIEKKNPTQYQEIGNSGIGISSDSEEGI